MGCQNNNETEKNTVDLKDIKTISIKSKPIQKQRKKEIKLSNALDVEVKDGKIIIDTKQTKDFLQSIGEKMRDGLTRVQHSFQKNHIKSQDETGIKITDTSVQIDFNKSRNFMNKWLNSMKSATEEIDKTMNEIDRDLNY